MIRRAPKKREPSQMELGIARKRENDRNFDKGGRSFYFFDFDDNIAFLSTPILIFHKENGSYKELTSGEFAAQSAFIGRSGVYKDYEILFDDDEEGSFKFFRDRDISLIQKLMGKKQCFVEDLSHALGVADFHWQGPSWSCFYHAVFNSRPISLITARGHAPKTIQKGIEVLVKKGHLPNKPNYLSVFPVSHIPTRDILLGSDEVSIPKLKQAAIRASVLKAFEIYGENPHHRFGMSDDDPKNIELIMEEMARLKVEFPENSFFVIDTNKGQFIKHEVFKDHVEDLRIEHPETQLELFRN